MTPADGQGGPVNTGGRHVPVALQLVIENLALEPGLVCADLTLGNGGHFRAIAKRIQPGGFIVGIDRDGDAIARAEAWVRQVSLDRVEMRLMHAEFGSTGEVLDNLGIATVDRFLMDLGLSSDQLEARERGFSFRLDGPLDMRQNQKQELTADTVVNEYGFDELVHVFTEFGEERYAAKIAEEIVKRRKRGAIESTMELAALVAGCVPSKGKTHPATRIFQAIRIEVGDELGQLRKCLPAVASRMSIGGRLAVITFHSLEDVVIKQSLRMYSRHANRQDWQIVPRGKVVKPSRDEIRGNPRSRSAKVRVYEKVRVKG